MNVSPQESFTRWARIYTVSGPARSAAVYRLHDDFSRACELMGVGHVDRITFDALLAQAGMLLASDAGTLMASGMALRADVTP